MLLTCDPGVVHEQRSMFERRTGELDLILLLLSLFSACIQT